MRWVAVVGLVLAGGLARADEPAPVLRPSTVRTIRVVRETWVRIRPDHRLGRHGLVRGGTRLAVRGEVPTVPEDRCRASLWFAVQPVGFVCGRDAEPTAEPPGGEPTLVVPPGRRVPFHYAIVRADSLNGFRSAEDVRAGVVGRTYQHGMMVALRGGANVDGVPFVRTWDRLLVAADGVRGMGAGSTWVGERLAPGARLPFGWVVSARARRWETADAGRPSGDRIPRRTRLEILEQRGGRLRTPAGWVNDEDVAVVRTTAPPAGVPAGARWIDVDAGEQVLVAYDGVRPVYATLVSTGTSDRTPLGDYPIWAKVASIDMDNQEGAATVYTVQRVPWVLFFQEHNAIHGAYWHDRFGRRASHGCVNLAPLDAAAIFDWALPPLPPGWESWVPDLAHSVVVHVRDSSRIPPFEQQAPIGPPRRAGEDDDPESQ